MALYKKGWVLDLGFGCQISDGSESIAWRGVACMDWM